jgi:putative tryptophan/tyrosine transport system substrate-binding protein
MRRRDFITLLGGAGLLCAAKARWARAQQPERTRSIGVLMGFTQSDSETTARVVKFRQELARLGWQEGHNLRIDWRFGGGSPDRFAALAKELVAQQPDVIVGHTTPVAAALHRETHTIPVVFITVSDPIGAGFIASLARPGRNFTGVLHYEEGIPGKWLALLKEIMPGIARVALLANPKTTAYDYFLRSAQVAAPSLGIELSPSPVVEAGDVERVIESFARMPNGGLVSLPDATMLLHRDLVIAQAAKHSLPAVYTAREFVVAGGLMSYGTNQVEMFGQTAPYVDRILRGTNPADLPVQAPTKYETILNLKAAKALGVEVPSSLLVRADEVIE